MHERTSNEPRTIEKCQRARRRESERGVASLGALIATVASAAAIFATAFALYTYYKDQARLSVSISNIRLGDATSVSEEMFDLPEQFHLFREYLIRRSAGPSLQRERALSRMSKRDLAEYVQWLTEQKADLAKREQQYISLRDKLDQYKADSITEAELKAIFDSSAAAKDIIDESSPLQVRPDSNFDEILSAIVQRDLAFSPQVHRFRERARESSDGDESEFYVSSGLRRVVVHEIVTRVKKEYLLTERSPTSSTGQATLTAAEKTKQALRDVFICLDANRRDGLSKIQKRDKQISSELTSATQFRSSKEDEAAKRLEAQGQVLVSVVVTNTGHKDTSIFPIALLTLSDSANRRLFTGSTEVEAITGKENSPAITIQKESSVQIVFASKPRSLLFEKDKELANFKDWVVTAAPSTGQAYLTLGDIEQNLVISEPANFKINAYRDDIVHSLREYAKKKLSNN